MMSEDGEDRAGAEQPAEPAGGRSAGRRSGTSVRVKWSIRIAFILLIVGAFVVGLDGLFYYPSRAIQYRPEDFSFEYEDVTFETSDGLRLNGWYFAADQPARGTVVHFHGNGQISVARKPLTRVPPNTWIHVEIVGSVGKDAARTFTVRVSRPGQEEQTFDDLPISGSEYGELHWLGFSSTAAADTTFYLDNVRFGLEEK